MTWLKLDDRFARHRKVAPLSDRAWRLHVTALLECCAELTDGQIDKKLPSTWPSAPRGRALTDAIRELEEAGLWEPNEAGWRVPTLQLGDRALHVAVFGENTWGDAAYEFVYARDGKRCRYCGSTDRLSIDHLIPRCQGGTDHESNLVVACRTCNSRKGGRTPEQAGMVLR